MACAPGTGSIAMTGAGFIGRLPAWTWLEEFRHDDSGTSHGCARASVSRRCPARLACGLVLWSQPSRHFCSVCRLSLLKSLCAPGGRNLLGVLTVSAALHAPSSCAAEDYLPAGRWSLPNGNFVCVPAGNHPPDQAHIEAQMAADSSSGDARWIGSCKASRFRLRAHGFEATLNCSQTQGVNGHAERFQVEASGFLEAPDRYTVSIAVTGGSKEVSTYKLVAPACRLDPAAKSVGPDARTSQPIDPDLQFLAGFPKEASTGVP